MARLRTAFIGCGGIANAHARALSATGRTELAAFCDIMPERARAFSDQYTQGKAPTYTEWHEMFKKERLDAVYICLPPFAHTDEVQVATKHGVHVFIEKPIALDMATAERMVKAVKAAKVKSQVGFCLRFGGASQEIRRMATSGEAGKPGLFVGRYFCNSIHSAWWRDKSRSGGQVVEQIIHVYDLARFFMGDVAEVFCAMDNLFHRAVRDYTVEDVSACVLRFKNGAIAAISATNGAIPNQWLSSAEVVFQNRTVYLSDANNATIHFTDAPFRSRSVVQSENDMMIAESLDFIEAIEKDRETTVPIIEGAKTLEAVLAAGRSAETGRPVKLGR